MSFLEKVASSLGFPIVNLPPDQVTGTHRSVFTYLVERMAEFGLLPPTAVDEVIAKLLKREMLGSSHIGEGFAIPHVMSSVDRVVGILARCASPLPWGGVREERVYTIQLILSPTERPGEYLRVLETISRAMKQDLANRDRRSSSR